MEKWKSDREMLGDFIKKQIEENDYYEKIREEYSKSNLEKQKDMEHKVYTIFMDWYNGYYSVWTILDTIEDYMESMTFDEVMDYEDFTIKDF